MISFLLGCSLSFLFSMANRACSHCTWGGWLETLVIFLQGSLFLVELCYGFLWGSTVCQVSAECCLKTSFGQSNHVITESWVFINFLLRRFCMPHFLGRSGTHSSTLEGFKFIVTSLPCEVFLLGSFWPSLTLLALQSHDPPNKLLALGQQIPCPPKWLQIPVTGGWKKVSVPFSASPLLALLFPYSVPPLTALQLSPYMALSWLHVHLLRGITWHA